MPDQYKNYSRTSCSHTARAESRINQPMKINNGLEKVVAILLRLGMACILAYSTFVYANKADVRMVIDVSGSMKRNDPKNLREPAVDLLVRLLPEESRAGVWTFGKYVNMLIPHRDVDDEWRNLARENASKINSVGLFTNIGAALEKASVGIGESSSGYSKSIILLTDGMVDVSKDPEENRVEWRRIIDDVIPKLQSAGITVHTVALSKHADKNLLEKIAIATGGTAAVANSADDLMKIFLDAFDVAAPAQQVPLQDNAFAVDSSVEEFTALIFRQNSDERTQLLGPDETLYESASDEQGVSWHRTNKYDLITVKRPLEGEWKVRANIAPESRVTVVSDLNLRVKSLPSNVFRGAQERLSFLLQEEGNTITDKTFLSLLNNTGSLGYGPKDVVTKQIWSHNFGQFAPPTDGIYRADLPQLRDIGSYLLEVVVDGKTFKRRFQHRIQVREPFTAELSEQVDDDGVARKVLSVKSHSNEVLPKKTQIAATIINPVNRKAVKPLALSEYDVWQTMIHMDQPGTYKISVQVTGEDIREESFEYTLEPMEIRHNPDSAFSQGPEATVQPPPLTENTVSSEAVSSSSQPSSEPSSSSQAQQASSAAEEPMEEPNEPDGGEATHAQGAVPAWLLYALLAVGNIVILGAGYFVFRKLMTDNSEDGLERFEQQEELEPAAEPDPPPVQEEIQEEDIAMDMGDGDDEEPPMEDLDPAEADLVEDAAEAPTAPPADEEIPMEDDFGVDDLEEEPSDAEMDERLQEEDDDLAAEMLKAQGLDLAEDELDDAITNLIDELDGEPDSAKEETEDFGSDIDDFDFGDDDEEDKK